MKLYKIVIAEKIKREEYFNPITARTEIKKKKVLKVIRNRHKISMKMVSILKASLGSLFSYETYYNGQLKKRDGKDIQVRIYRRKLKADGYEITIAATKKVWLSVKELLHLVLRN